MAKKKTSDGDINKSEELRKYLRQHPEAGAATIIPEFADRGIEITRSLVSWVKQDMKKKGDLPAAPPKSAKKTTKKKAAPKKTTKKKPSPKKKAKATKRGKKAAAKTTPSPQASKPQTAGLTAEDLMDAKKLADELGGIEQVRRALKYLEDLS